MHAPFDIVAGAGCRVGGASPADGASAVAAALRPWALSTVNPGDDDEDEDDEEDGGKGDGNIDPDDDEGYDDDEDDDDEEPLWARRRTAVALLRRIKTNSTAVAAFRRPC